MTEEELKPLLTPEVLNALTEAARLYGNSGDWPAVRDFVEFCYSTAEQPVPDLTPYDV